MSKTRNKLSPEVRDRDGAWTANIALITNRRARRRPRLLGRNRTCGPP